MPPICSFFEIIIKMYSDEPEPPHFHAYYQGYSAMFGIETCELMIGKFPKRQTKLVEGWAEIYKDELWGNWLLLKNDEYPVSIPPLQ